MKIFGISLVRNEADIIGVSVLQQLSLGVDRIIVVDNGSTDGTDGVLKRLAKDDERVSWTRDESPFDQTALTTELAREAHRRGADWILPFDADEFWWSRGGKLRETLANSSAGALRARLTTFVQARSQHESTTENLLTMTGRAADTLPAGKLTQHLVQAHQVATVQLTGRGKWVSRPTTEIEIGRGNHNVSGVDGEPGRAKSIVCFHAMLRSRALLASKMERSHRLKEAGITRGASRVWHWARVIEEGNLDREWAANSYEDGHLDVYGKRYPAAFDPRLQRIVAPHVLRLSEDPDSARRALAEAPRWKGKRRKKRGTRKG